MAQLVTTSRAPSFTPGMVSPPPHAGAHGRPTEETYALTDSQKEILAMLEDKPQAIPEAAAEAVERGYGLDVAFATLGAAAVVSGVVLVFFFAALGAVLLVLGAIMCAVAFEHVALNDLRAQEAELDAASIAPMSRKN